MGEIDPELPFEFLRSTHSNLNGPPLGLTGAPLTRLRVLHAPRGVRSKCACITD